MIRHNRLCLILSLIIFSIGSKNNLFAQNWTRFNITNNWGDIIEYGYNQIIRSAVAHKDKDVTVAVSFVVAKAEGIDALVIVSLTTGELIYHPGAGFVDEPITLSLSSNGTTTSYVGTTRASSGNYNKVAMITYDNDLIEKLHGQGQWDVLIEGRRWYIRTTIRGNLPILE
jgi:hypothetical protein